MQMFSKNDSSKVYLNMLKHTVFWSQIGQEHFSESEKIRQIAGVLLF